MGKKIFICHSTQDKNVGDYLYNTLIKLGIESQDIFYSSNIFNGVELNSSINSYIEEKIADCDYVIALLSEDFFESKFCLNEIGAFWILKKNILPIIIDDLEFFSKIDFAISDRLCVRLKDGIETSQLILKKLQEFVGIDNNQKNLLLIENFRQDTLNNLYYFSLDKIDFKYKNSQNEDAKIKKLERKFNKSISNSHSLEEFLNDVLSSNVFLNALVDSCGANFSYENVAIKIANVINYYILTRNFVSSYYIFFEIMNSVGVKNFFLNKNFIFEGIKKVNNNLNEQELANKLILNFYKNGFVTHSCNPIYLKNILENGLGYKITDSDTENNLVDLENVIYKNKFFSRQENSTFYYTIPSANAIHYAIGLSPERVFGGPLKILSKNLEFNKDSLVANMPHIYVGENIKHYYKRVAKNNLNIAVTNNKILIPIKKIIKKKLYKLVNDFCFDYSYLLLIPVDKCDLTAYDKKVNSTKEQKFEYYINNLTCKNGVDINNISTLDEAYNLIKYITPKSIGQNDKTYMGNLCSNKIIKNTEVILKIKIPTFFKICQFYLKRKYHFGKKVKIKINPYMK